MPLKTAYLIRVRVILATLICALILLTTSARGSANQFNAPSEQHPDTSTVQEFLRLQGLSTRGGLRRGPFEIGRSTKRIQVAFVIDSSLDEKSLGMLRELIPVFLKQKVAGDEDPERVIVGAKNGAYVVNDFQTSDAALLQQFDALTGSGSSNQVDFWDGVKTAVERLQWDARRNSLRWVIVCGNAASKKRTPDQEQDLIRLARIKNISIISLLFRASPKTLLASRERAKQVLTSLSSETAGTFVNLGSQSSIDYWYGHSTELKEPTRIDAPKEDDMTIRVVGRDSDQDGKTLEVMRRVLQQLPCSVVYSPDAKYSIDVNPSNYRGRITIQASLKSEDVELASARIISLDSWDQCSLQDAAMQCLHELLTRAARTLNDSHGELRKRIREYLDRDRKLRCVVATHPRARDEIMSALKLLRQSHIEDPSELQQTTKRVIAHLNNADFYDPGNAFALLLRANAQFNLAQAARESGDQQGEEQTHRRRYLMYLGQAFQASDALDEKKMSPIRKVIEAEYRLGNGEFEKAIELYEEIAAIPQLRGTTDLELRARWMLCGLYDGDWNISSEAEELKSYRKSLEHMKEIIRRWPNSPEARLLRNQFNENRKRLPSTQQRYAVTFSSALPTDLISNNTVGD